jgi:hypothetical protein
VYTQSIALWDEANLIKFQTTKKKVQIQLYLLVRNLQQNLEFNSDYLEKNYKPTTMIDFAT